MKSTHTHENFFFLKKFIETITKKEKRKKWKKEQKKNF